MTILLGIDGGGTGCRAAIANDSGEILGRGMGGSANVATDPVAARESILAAVQDAIRNSRLEIDPANMIAGLGLAGVNIAGTAESLRKTLPFRKCHIQTDAIAAARGALGYDDGIVAAIGTGSVFAIQKNRTLRTVGGWGLVLGDEGSGAWIGRALLGAALRAVDGLVENTPLLADLVARFGGPAQLVAHFNHASPAEFATFAREVVGSDDPAAQTVLAAARDDIRQVLCRLRKDYPLPVTFVGGLGAWYAASLKDFPQRSALGTALDGALLLAREAA